MRRTATCATYRASPNWICAQSTCSTTMSTTARRRCGSALLAVWQTCAANEQKGLRPHQQWHQRLRPFPWPPRWHTFQQHHPGLALTRRRPGMFQVLPRQNQQVRLVKPRARYGFRRRAWATKPRGQRQRSSFHSSVLRRRAGRVLTCTSVSQQQRSNYLHSLLPQCIRPVLRWLRGSPPWSWMHQATTSCNRCAPLKEWDTRCPCEPGQQRWQNTRGHAPSSSSTSTTRRIQTQWQEDE